MTMRFAPIILLIGILFNLVCVFVFRLKLDRVQNDRFLQFSSAVRSQVSDLTTSALSAIDSYFVSNQVRQVHQSRPSSSSSTTVNVNLSPIYETVGDWSYSYSEMNSVPYATVGFRHYKAGDIFPRGGVITQIHPDGVVVDGRYWLRNYSADRRSFSVSDNSVNLQKRTTTNDTRTDSSL